MTNEIIQTKQNYLTNTIYINWNDTNLLSQVIEQIRKGSSIVPIIEIQTLRNKLKQIYHSPKSYFILQCGPCAESLKDNKKQYVHKLLNLIINIADIISNNQKNIIIITRLAGQYAKSRSHKFEKINNIMIPTYKGDMINSINQDILSRTPNPKRILEAYYNSQKTIKFIQEFNITNHYWIFTSHEALVTEYENALKRASHNNEVFITSAHFLWVGTRTTKMVSPQIQTLQHTINPIGIKIGHTINIKELIQIIKFLNPLNEKGKICLIPRLGLPHIKQKLPPIIECVLENNCHVLWVCDPMHGNTHKKFNRKYRLYEEILEEFESFNNILNNYNLYPNGIHLEITHEDVIECLTNKNTLNKLNQYRYTSLCDPRLNFEQAICLAKDINKIIT